MQDIPIYVHCMVTTSLCNYEQPSEEKKWKNIYLIK